MDLPPWSDVNLWDLFKLIHFSPKNDRKNGNKKPNPMPPVGTSKHCILLFLDIVYIYPFASYNFTIELDLMVRKMGSLNASDGYQKMYPIKNI